MSTQTLGHADDGFSWTNASVRALAGDADPLAKILTTSRRVMAEAADTGLDGPPFDPFRLAEMLGLALRARADVADARLAADTIGVHSTPDAPLSGFVLTSEPLAVEYNPTRPRGRMRFNVAHEIAHALFPDAAEASRHRTGAGAVPQYDTDDSWQLELLCNVAAAEFLMPTEAVAGISNIDPDIDFIMAQRQRFDVSTEALLRRLATATTRQLAVLAAGRIIDRPESALRVEYVVPSRSYVPAVQRGDVIEAGTVVAQCTAAGQTGRGILTLAGEQLRVQAVGLPPYPGRALARVLIIAEPVEAPTASPVGLRFISGDVTSPNTSAPVIIGHITNDRAHAWGGRGVAAALARRFPDVAKAYRYWTIARPENLRLGQVHVVEASSDPSIRVASMVAQRAYGTGSPDRVVYSALAEALHALGEAARTFGAQVHLARIGTGQAGGRWDLIEAEIDEELVRRGIDVTVYTLPSRPRQALC